MSPIMYLTPPPPKNEKKIFFGKLFKHNALFNFKFPQLFFFGAECGRRVSSGSVIFSRGGQAMPLIVNASVSRRLSWSIDRRSVCLKVCHLTYGIISPSGRSRKLKVNDVQGVIHSSWPPGHSDVHNSTMYSIVIAGRLS